MAQIQLNGASAPSNGNNVEENERKSAENIQKLGYLKFQDLPEMTSMCVCV